MLPHFRLISFLFLFSLAYAGCKKEPFMAKAIITGFDSRACSCCGGLMLTFTSDPQPYQGAFLLVVNEASELGISSATIFPVHMKVDYELLTLCSGEIRITKYKRLP